MEEEEWTEVENYSYLWKEKKEDYVLIKPTVGDEILEYAIIDKKHQMMLMMEDNELAKKLVEKMLENGKKIYEDINEAYKDV